MAETATEAPPPIPRLDNARPERQNCWPGSTAWIRDTRGLPRTRERTTPSFWFRRSSRKMNGQNGTAAETEKGDSGFDHTVPRRLLCRVPANHICTMADRGKSILIFVIE